MTKGLIDREQLHTSDDIINLVVAAVDGGFPPRSTSTNVLIRVIDINDNVPILSEPVVNLTLLEGFGPGAIYHIQVNFTSQILFSIFMR